MTGHALDRIEERYNVVLNYKDLEAIIKQIQRGETLYVSERESITRCFHYVKYNHIPYKVLYQKPHKRVRAKIVTVYPFDVDEYNELLKIHEQEKELKIIKRFTEYLNTKGYVVYKEGEQQC